MEPLLPPDWPTDGSQGAHVLVKPTGAECNLDCKYCFYLEKEALYPGVRPRMEDAVVDRYLRQLFEAHRGAKVVPVAWQGGEPTLMGLPFFQRAMARVEALREPGQEIQHTFQTNGVRLDEEWCRFFKQHDVLVGLSIDGPREVHDAYRVDKGGRGSFDQVVRAARMLMQHEVAVNALVCVHAANQDHPLEVYRFLRDELGFRYIQLLGIVERTDHGSTDAPPLAGHDPAAPPVTDRSVRPEAYGEFLCAIFDEWVRRDVGTVFIPTFEAALANWLGLPAGMCIHRETCGGAVALEHQGDVYACDHYVDPAHRLGNIGQKHLAAMLQSDALRQFGLDKRDTLPGQCRRCPVRFACHGECPKNRMLRTEEGEPGLNYLCAGYYRFYTHIDRPMRTLADLLSRGQPAELVMRLLALEEQGWPGYSRNEPCPCGSGRKLKKCHAA